MEKFKLERVYLQNETLGSIYNAAGELICKTMELPWKENRRSISCIPEGTYRVIAQHPKADRPYFYFRLPDVPGRSGILIHRITYVKDLKGCIGVGGRHIDLNKDGVPDMVDSGKKLTWMVVNLPSEFELIITEKKS